MGCVGPLRCFVRWALPIDREEAEDVQLTHNLLQLRQGSN